LKLGQSLRPVGWGPERDPRLLCTGRATPLMRGETAMNGARMMGLLVVQPPETHVSKARNAAPAYASSHHIQIVSPPATATVVPYRYHGKVCM
jgi:hypothetical protein